MDPNREWTAKDDMEALLLCLKEESGPPPPKVDHQKLQEVEEMIKRSNEKKKKKKKYERPIFTEKRLTKPEWDLLLDSYEAELHIILTKALDQDSTVEELAKLELWFFSFYPPPPRINSVEGIEVWKNEYISFAKRRHTDLLPFEYRKSVSEKVREMLSEKWEDTYIQEITRISEGVIVFRKVNLVKLAPSVKRMVVLNK